ncbi:MAG: methyltransferase domain-containing protein [Thermodesulfobacteriota bacterium]
MEESRKRRIRQRFSRAAATYDAHAEVQPQLVTRLLRMLPQEKPGRILELGCGTGSLTMGLAARYPEVPVVGVDFAEGMLRQARLKLAGQPQVVLVCEDGERFLAGCSTRFGLVCANAVLHWFSDPAGAVAQVRRLLAPGGSFVGAIFGERTFAELGEGMQAVLAGEVSLPSSRFPDRTRAEAMLASCFGAVEIQELLLTRQYDSLFAQLDHIRRTGVGGGQRQVGLLTRRRLVLLDQWFQSHHGGYPATYQAFLFRCTA